MKKMALAILLCSTPPLYAATLCSSLLASFARIDGTDRLSAYIAKLLEQKILSNEELSQFIENLENGEIKNPIADIKTGTSSASLMQHDGIDELIKEIKIDRTRLLKWAKQTQQMQSAIRMRRSQAQVDTHEIYQQIVFLPIPPGTFIMHEESRKARVTLTHPIEVMSTPVTQKQWSDLMGENPSRFDIGEESVVMKVNGSGIKMQPDHPVESITWYSAAEFCNRLSRQKGLKPAYDFSEVLWEPDTSSEDGTLDAIIHDSYRNEKINAPGENIYLAEGYRLPTDAESAYFRGLAAHKAGPKLEHYAWYLKNSDSQTHAVAQLKPILINGGAFYDVFGNVWEWTHDFMRDEFKGGRDLLGPRTSLACSARSGCWSTLWSLQRSHRPEKVYAEKSDDDLGFRVVRTLQ
jgi:sulfatase modifying factor 1